MKNLTPITPEGQAKPSQLTAEGVKALVERNKERAAFYAGYSCGHASGMNEASDDRMRHNDAPDVDEAWGEHLAAAEGK